MTSVNVADVNWLLSALTQASAAMIAIVGGLLVTRYVALHAEQASSQRRVDDLKRRLEAAESQYKAAHEALRSGEIDELLDDTDVYKAALNARLRGEEMDAATALEVAEHDGDGLDHELLTQKVAALNREIQAALSAVAPLVTVAKRQPDWDAFRRSNGVVASRPDVWRWVYGEVTHQAILAAREAEKKKNPYGMASLALTDTYIRLPFQAVDREERRVQREWRRTAADQASAGVEQLAQEQRLAQENLDAARQPEGFSLAIRVLIALAVLGMGVPVVVMTLGVVEIHWALRGLVSALFFAGVGLLLRFLLVYADFLREGGRTSLPRNLSGLLRR